MSNRLPKIVYEASESRDRQTPRISENVKMQSGRGVLHNGNAASPEN